MEWRKSVSNLVMKIIIKNVSKLISALDSFGLLKNELILTHPTKKKQNIYRYIPIQKIQYNLHRNILF